MKVIDTINKTELDLTVDEIIDLVANSVSLPFYPNRTSLASSGRKQPFRSYLLYPL